MKKKKIIKAAKVGPPKQYGGISKCIHCGCKLSIYNSTDACAPCSEKGKIMNEMRNDATPPIKHDERLTMQELERISRWFKSSLARM